MKITNLAFATLMGLTLVASAAYATPDKGGNVDNSSGAEATGGYSEGGDGGNGGFGLGVGKGGDGGDGFGLGFSGATNENDIDNRSTSQGGNGFGLGFSGAESNAKADGGNGLGVGLSNSDGGDALAVGGKSFNLNAAEGGAAEGGLGLGLSGSNATTGSMHLGLTGFDPVSKSGAVSGVNMDVVNTAVSNSNNVNVNNIQF